VSEGNSHPGASPPFHLHGRCRAKAAGSRPAFGLGRKQNIVVVAKTSAGGQFSRPGSWSRSTYRLAAALLIQQFIPEEGNSMGRTPRLKWAQESQKGDTIEIKTLMPAHHGVGSAGQGQGRQADPAQRFIKQVHLRSSTASLVNF